MGVQLRVLTLIVWMIWPFCTWAAAVTLGSTLGGVPGDAWVAVVLVSAVSGLLALLQRMNKAAQLEQQLNELEKTPENAQQRAILRDRLTELQLPTALSLFVTWHMVGSLVMGFICFMVLEAGDVNDFVEAALISLAGYCGAILVDKLSGAFGNRSLRTISDQ